MQITLQRNDAARNNATKARAISAPSKTCSRLIRAILDEARKKHDRRANYTPIFSPLASVVKQ
jgi:hypothetical protein